MAGEHARAEALCRETLSLLTPLEASFTAYNGEIEQQLVAACAGQGRVTEAIQLVDAMLERNRTGDNPLVLGNLHRMRAELALVLRDAVAFTAHLDRVEHWFKSTQNPALMAQWERLRDAGGASGLYALVDARRRVLSDLIEPDASEHASLSAIVTASVARTERINGLLQRLLTAAGSASGHLFVVCGKRLELAASCGVGAPPEWLRQRVDALFGPASRSVLSVLPRRSASAGAEQEAGSDDDGDEDEHEVTKTVHTQPFTIQLGERFCRIVALVSQQSGMTRVIGAAAIELDPESTLQLSGAALAQFAQALESSLDSMPPPANDRAGLSVSSKAS